MIKKVNLPYYESGHTGFYARVVQIYTGNLLDNADGNFRASPGNLHIPLTEGQPSIYGFTENRQTWDNGPYQVYGYDNSGNLFAVAELFIFYNREVSFSEMERAILEGLEDVDQMLVPTYPAAETSDVDNPPVFDEEPDQ